MSPTLTFGLATFVHKFAQRDDPFRFVADIDDDRIRIDLDDRSPTTSPTFNSLEAALEELTEALFLLAELVFQFGIVLSETLVFNHSDVTP